MICAPKPDASSPRSEFKITPPYSRFLYLSLSAAILSILDSVSHSDIATYVHYYILLEREEKDELIITCRDYSFYGYHFNPVNVINNLISILSTMVLYSPIFHLFGVLPQPDTLLIYSLEQINIHLFGGSGNNNHNLNSFLLSIICVGVMNLRSAIFDFVRNCVSVGIMFGVGVLIRSRSEGTMTLYIGLMLSFSYPHSFFLSFI